MSGSVVWYRHNSVSGVASGMCTPAPGICTIQLSHVNGGARCGDMARHCRTYAVCSQSGIQVWLDDCFLPATNLARLRPGGTPCQTIDECSGAGWFALPTSGHVYGLPISSTPCYTECASQRSDRPDGSIMLPPGQSARNASQFHFQSAKSDGGQMDSRVLADLPCVSCAGLAAIWLASVECFALSEQW
jgi:hypothetical protein